MTERFSIAEPEISGRRLFETSKRPIRQGNAIMTQKIEIFRGSENPFEDAGLPEPNTKLLKVDLAAEIIRILREREMTGAQAAKATGFQESDISRIRNADLGRFTIDRLVTILNRLDHEVCFTVRPVLDHCSGLQTPEPTPEIIG